MVHRVVLPDLGEGIAEAHVLEWLVQPGQAITADEPLVEVTTDKVDVVMPSPVTGVVASLRVEPGRLVPVGTVLAEITIGEHRAGPRASPGASALLSAAGTARPAAGGAAVASPGRATIARRLAEAAAVPTVTAVDEADFGSVLAAGRPPLGIKDQYCRLITAMTVRWIMRRMTVRRIASRPRGHVVGARTRADLAAMAPVRT